MNTMGVARLGLYLILFIFPAFIMQGCYVSAKLDSLLTTSNSPKIQFTQAQYSLLTGESVILSMTEGQAPYTFSSISGAIDAATGLYTVPLNTAPYIDSVTGIDSLGQKAQAQVTVRAFETNNRFRLDATSGSGGSSYQKVAMDLSGAVYVVGTITESNSVQKWVVRKSTDSGVSWSTLDTYQLTANKKSVGLAIKINSSGVIFVVGYALDGNANSYYCHWIVRKSADGGLTWATVDDYFQTNVTYDAIPYGIAFDSSNNIYVVGGVSLNLPQWRVRKSSDGGSTWSFIDTYEHYTSHTAVAQDIFVDGNGYLYVIGYGTDSSFSSHWIVRKSTDGGVSWNTIDDYQLFGGKSAYGLSLKVASNGDIYTTGRAADSSNSYHWIVRKSTDGGVSWNTVDDYQFSALWSSQANDVFIDSTGDVFVAGDAYDSSNLKHWIVRKTTDGGSSWSGIDDYLRVGGSNQSAGLSIIGNSGGANIAIVGWGMDVNGISRATMRFSSDSGATWSTASDTSSGYIGKAASLNSLFQDLSGNLYVAIASYGLSDQLKHWVIRKSVDSGSTWTIIDDYVSSTSNSCTVNSITKSHSNDIYAVGTCIGTGSFYYWTVRKSSNEGASWSTVDSLVLVGGSYSVPMSVVADTNGNIFVGGYATDNTSRYHWIVRKSTDAGSTWNTIDDFQMVSNKNSYLKALHVDISGNIFAVGSGEDSSNVKHWIVRKSSDIGVSWSIVNNYQLSSSTEAEPQSITSDSTGQLYVAGSAQGSSAINHWLVRKSSDGGVSWSTIDDYQKVSSSPSVAFSIVKDSSQQIYVSGYIIDDSGQQSWVIRKSNNEGVSWAVVDEIQGVLTAETNAKTIISCLQSRICAGGALTESLSKSTEAIVRILSPL